MSNFQYEAELQKFRGENRLAQLRNFNIELDEITFNVSISSFKHRENWVVKSEDKGHLGRIIESIGKYHITKYGESV